MKQSTPTRPVLLSVKQVSAQTSFSTSHIYKLVEKETFPHPVRLGTSRRVAWRQSDVTEWIEEQFAAQNNDAA
jgi:excisionase family DNA binding protein